MAKAECPSCFFEWDVDDANIMEGEVISCPDCGCDLEVASKDGETLKLEKLDSSGEDWGE
jgi:lysine biosynthesis protein LysW